MSDATSFSQLRLQPALLGNLADIGYNVMTDVQAHALPALLAGADVLVRAKTGSGKTAAFGLSLLNRVDTGAYRVQALVLCPTRELADQVAAEIRRLARTIPNVKVLSVCGGAPFAAQVTSLKRSPHIVVGTPGRVLKHLRKENLGLGHLQTLVLDEADRMLDMGFADELDAILAFVPVQRQTLLFSATYPESIAAISKRVQKDPLVVDVSEVEEPALITQYWCPASGESRPAELLKVIHAWGGALNLVFCNTKIDCRTVARYLQAEDVAALELHGDMDQFDRTQALIRFANQSANVLVATDVAARGLDVRNLDAVFNYELPPQPEVYIHRIGRTGRAGEQGVAVSLVAPREIRRLQAIESVLPEGTLRQQCMPDRESPASLRPAEMTTIWISGGRKDKVRPGDLLGALTAKSGVAGEAVGRIDILDTCSYVAVRRKQAGMALQQLRTGPIKGRQYRVRVVR